jgi:hypothetical protein
MQNVVMLNVVAPYLDPLASVAGWENDLRIALMGLTNLKFDQLGLRPLSGGTARV